MFVFLEGLNYDLFMLQNIFVFIIWEILISLVK